MSDSMNIREQIREGVDAALERHGHVGDDLSWDVGYSMVMTPNGPAVNSFFVVTMRSPIMGGPPLAAPLIIDPRALREPEAANEIVMNILMKLREARAQMLSVTNGSQ
jgi:hypothetical protein